MAFNRTDRAHQIYKLADGTRVPGVSTIVGVMDKPHLVKWANNLGLNGIDSSKYVDSLASAGTLAHYLVERNLADLAPDQSYLDEFSIVDMDRALVSFNKYLSWKSGRKVVVVWSEKQLVSEQYRFGGQIDLLAELDGEITLVDVKTCKALYGPADEKWAQVAGYDVLVCENGVQPVKRAILRLGRDQDEGFEFAYMDKDPMQRQRFLHCLDLYRDIRTLNSKASG